MLTVGAWNSIKAHDEWAAPGFSEPGSGELQGKGLSFENTETFALIGRYKAIMFLTCFELRNAHFRFEQSIKSSVLLGVCF